MGLYAVADVPGKTEITLGTSPQAQVSQLLAMPGADSLSVYVCTRVHTRVHTSPELWLR